MNIDIKLKKVCGVYYFKLNNDMYIGSSTDIYSRLHRHKSFFKNNSHIKLLQDIYNTNPIIESGVLLECNKENLVELEKELIVKYNPYLNTIRYKKQYYRGKKSQQLRDLIKEQVTERFYNNHPFSKVVESQRKPVYVYNSITLEIIKYESQTKCAEILNIGRKIVRNRLKTMNSYNSLYFSYINEFPNK